MGERDLGPKAKNGETAIITVHTADESVLVAFLNRNNISAQSFRTRHGANETSIQIPLEDLLRLFLESR